jgi:hypothetical protein
MDEQVYMALKSIEQGPHEKLEVYYERIFKLAKNLQDKVKDNLLVTFFRASLQPYLCVAMALAKCDNFFQQKEIDVQCEKIMGNVKDDSSQQIREGQQKGFDLWPLSQTK